MDKKQFDKMAVAATRVLSVEAVQKANSGHPGMPLGAAPLAWQLWAHHMKHNPAHPDWIDRDRFILSAGHASAMLYALLFLCGYDLTEEDLGQFRQFGSRTPGHPEYRDTPGVEMTTGPLGQGIASAVGFAMAEAHLAARFNRGEHKIVNHYTYALCGDGCLMEGVSSEASSLAGTLKLGKLIVFYDRNEITIEGSTDLSFAEDVAARYRSYGWQVLEVADGNDLAALSKATEEAKADLQRPSLVISHSRIGEGSPLVGSEKTHGSPLGEENLRLTKEALGWPTELAPFALPAGLSDELARMRTRLAEQEQAWRQLFHAWRAAYPDLACEWDRCFSSESPNLAADPRFWQAPEKAEATRVSSSRCLNILAEKLPNLMGGSADLGPSNNSVMKNFPYFSADCPEGRNIHFGVREFAMACCMNGMNLHGGIRGYCATFFVFSDYLKPAARLSALMNIPALYILTHDSIGVGEDGPTHEPIEHLAALRATPNLLVFRPADYRECSAAWIFAIESRRPSAFVLSRQNLPQIEGSGEALYKGAYIVKDALGAEIIFIASGSELKLALAAHDALKEEGVASRVVSMPCMELFLEQDEAYQHSVLPPECEKRIAIEAGASMPWYRFVGPQGRVVALDRFGASGPGDTLFETFGFTAARVIEEARLILKR